MRGWRWGWGRWGWGDGGGGDGGGGVGEVGVRGWVKIDKYWHLCTGLLCCHQWPLWSMVNQVIFPIWFSFSCAISWTKGSYRKCWSFRLALEIVHSALDSNPTIQLSWFIIVVSDACDFQQAIPFDLWVHRWSIKALMWLVTPLPPATHL